MMACKPTMGNEGAEVDLLDGRERLDKVPKASKGFLADYFIKERKAVLFVGEGNFTFSVAFAALREAWRIKKNNGWSHLPKVPPPKGPPSPWEGIISTRLERKKDKPVPVLAEVKKLCIKNISDWVHDESLRSKPMLIGGKFTASKGSSAS